MTDSARVLITTLAAALVSMSAGNALACASCGCSINSDWGAQGISSASGWTLDMRYDVLDQNKLWKGTHSISASSAAATTNNKTGDPAEVERYTDNRYYTANVDYNDGESWGLSLSVPIIDRRHSTLGVGSDGRTFDSENGAYKSSTSRLGDVRVTARFFGFSEARNFGVQVGLKLPTGKKNQFANDGSGAAVDPGLQVGTGTTDLILGAFYFDSFGDNWGYFTQATVQTALDHSNMDAGSYRPGNSLNLSVGTRYKGFSYVTPSVQLNARYAKRDSGAAADTYATGGTLVYLTLGAITRIGDSVEPFVNVQLPVYQDVNGIQLTPKYTLSFGAKVSF